MSVLRSISLNLLVVEACLLFIPSIAGFIICIFGLFNTLFGLISHHDISAVIKIFSAIIIILSLISFWDILLDAIKEKFLNGKKLNNYYLLFSSIGILLTISSVMFNAFDINFLQIFIVGQLFVPTYLHLLLEIRRQS